MTKVLTGDWNGLFAKLDQLKHIDKELEDDMQREAINLRDNISEYVTGQQGAWTPLDPDTVEEKDSSIVLVDTGMLANSFTVEKQGENEYLIHPTGQNSDLSNEQLAIYQEYGTSTIPPRPFVRPVYERDGGKTVDNIGNAVKEIISK